MKKYVFALLFISLSSIAYSQTKVNFYYDASGNRIKRKVITVPPESGNTAGSGTGMEKRAEKKETPKAPIQDKAGAYNFSFHPNPTSGRLTIEVDATFLNEQNKQAFLFDMNGILLQQQDVNSTTVPFDLTGYAPGFYLLKILADGYKAEWTVVKQ